MKYIILIALLMEIKRLTIVNKVILTSDGLGIVLASKLKKNPVHQRFGKD
jgi:hypothetical protein